MKEIKCKSCGNWSVNTVNCMHCNFSFPQYRNSSEPEEKIGASNSKVSKPQMSSKFKRYLDALYFSKNPFKKLLYYLLMGIWSLYVGLVVLMLYIAVLGSG